MTKIDLITGFLGSGKTTFLVGYAKYLMRKGMKIGILEYDYGAVNIDMLLLNELRGPQCELEMLSAACDADCHKRRFKTKLIAMAMSGYDRVIIEPSGVFDIDEFFDALSESPLDRWYEADNVITVIDCKDKSDYSEYSDYMLASQAAPAGCILVNSYGSAADHASETVDYLKKALTAIKCGRNIDRALFVKDVLALSDDDYKTIAGKGYYLCDFEKKQDFDSEFESISFLNVELTLEEYEKKAAALFTDCGYGRVIRIKGFVRTAGQWFCVNYSLDGRNSYPVDQAKPALIVTGTGLNERKIRDFIDPAHLSPNDPLNYPV